jgi:hypothetical protein
MKTLATIDLAELERDLTVRGAAYDLLEVCESIVALCDATLVDPEEMSPEWVGIYHDLRGAIDKAYGR